MNQLLVSYIILSCNRRDMVLNAIASVAAQRYSNKEIIIVDNGSTDGTVELLRASHPEVRVLASKTNIGPAAARNKGILASRGEFIVLLDDDCELTGERSTESVVGNFLADERCGAVSLRIIDPVTGWGWPYNVYESHLAPLAHECAIFRSGGVALRRSTLDEVGLFWEPFFIVAEDTELALRIVASGWRVVGRGDLIVLHPAPDPKARPNAKREIYFKVRNTIWLALRSIPASMVPGLIILTLGRGLNLAIRWGKIPLFIHALIDSLRQASNCWRERRPLTRERVLYARKLSMKLWT
jgi:GT2 family glycosyltransferase